MDSSSGGKKGKKVSIARNNSYDIQPVAYSFRVPNKYPASDSITTASKPPYWLYHDHALGVIWMLFHKDKNQIGISKLHWCRRFLLDLKNSRGEYAGDVEICIRAIEDDLIELYSKLGAAWEKSLGETSGERKKLSKVPGEAIDTILDAEREEEALRDSNKQKSAITVQENQSTLRNELEILDDHEEMQGTSTPKENKSQVDKIESKKDSDSEEVKCSSRCAAPAGRKKKEEMVSFTYREMMARGAAPCTKEYLIEDSHDDSSFIEETMEKTANEIVREGNPDGRALADMNTRELTNFLNVSRRQHLERIKKEIERLYGLEKFMENIGGKDFSAYITADLARRVETLRDDDVVKVAEEIIK